MLSSTTAIWTAVAAMLAVLISGLILLIQRRNLLESARPELVLTGWSRRVEGEGDAAHDRICFQTIGNVGRGVALHVNIGAFHKVDTRPTAVMSTMSLPILAVDENKDVNGEIIVWWKNVIPDGQRHKHLAIVIKILCWDTRGMRHETRYNLFAIQPSPDTVVVPDPVAPGVMLGSRTTRTRPVWLLKLSGWVWRKPGLNWIYRKYVNPKIDDDWA